MRNFVLGFLMAAGFILAGATMASAGPAGSADLRGTVAEGGTVQNVEWGYCKRLRRACVYKNERGEEGQGNCRRYREECGQRPGGYDSYERRDSYDRRDRDEHRYSERQRRCSQLRFACKNKDDIGEAGQGNCRRYRQECGGY